jgi:trehalose 6-phosphate synthase/phosphatase
MSSYRSHRVIIATLFLPQTAVLGDSPPDTPHPLPTQLPLPSLFNLKIPERPPYGRNKTSAPLKSIVEDMRDKVNRNLRPIFHCITLSLTTSTTDREILTDKYPAGDHPKQRTVQSVCQFRPSCRISCHPLTRFDVEARTPDHPHRNSPEFPVCT